MFPKWHLQSPIETLPRALEDPCGHLVHSVFAIEFLYFPVAHGTHVDSPVNPAPHAQADAETLPGGDVVVAGQL